MNNNYFVQSIIGRIKNDKACLAALRRADNPSTEYQSWEYLASFDVDLSKSHIRLPYAIIAAAIAKSEPNKNGVNGIGHCLANCYPDGNNSDQAKAKLRRLLSCDTVEEVCLILRHLFNLVQSKSSSSLNFSLMLKQLLLFNHDSQTIKSYWAQEFYGRNQEEEVPV